MVDTTNPAYTHGHAAKGQFSPEYHSWSGMIQRCTNPKRDSYKHYGGRGIKVCPRWMTFTNFLADMGPRPPGLTLERKNNAGDYEPGNCIWADDTTQARNTRQAVWVEINGVRKRLVEWCEELGMSINTVRHRVKYHGFDYATALTTPRQTNADRGHRGRFQERGEYGGSRNVARGGDQPLR